MHKGHFRSAGASIDHGDASALFPVESLGVTVHQRRDAELALGDVDGSDVIVIVPTSMASSYVLTQHTLTAIPINSLSDAVQADLDTKLDSPIEAFSFVQIGKWTRDSANHSLAEFTDA